MQADPPPCLLSHEAHFKSHSVGPGTVEVCKCDSIYLEDLSSPRFPLDILLEKADHSPVTDFGP